MKPFRIFPLNFSFLLLLTFFWILTLSISAQATPSRNEELVRALSVSDIAKVQALLAQGADVNLQDMGGWTALMLASMRGDEAVVKVLLENGAKVNLQRNDGWTALILASTWGHETVVKTLLENGADVNQQTKDGWTALMSAVAAQHETVVKTLLENGADVNAKHFHAPRDDAPGNTVLSYARTDNIRNLLIAAGAK